MLSFRDDDEEDNVTVVVWNRMIINLSQEKFTNECIGTR
jgi:hypothetical protein